MGGQKEELPRTKIEAEILRETLSTLTELSDTFGISIGEAIDRLAGFYRPSRNQRIRLELADLLYSEQHAAEESPAGP